MPSPARSEITPPTLLKHAGRIAATIALIAGVSGIAQAAVLHTFTDESSFLAASGAASIGPLPGGGGSGTTVGAVTFTNGTPIGSIAFGDWSNELPGNDLALSGLENFRMSIAGGAYSYGFAVHEPTTPRPPGPPGCNTDSCVDSTFRIDFLSGSATLGSFTYNAPDDVSTASGGPVGFFGLTSDTLFDRVLVTEVSGTNDNEYFGRFSIGTTPVPEPASLVMLAAGLAGIGAARRDRRRA